jgi:4a-hydroxytetrahydrobiopterin dehydratase
MPDRRPLSPAELDAALPGRPDWRAGGGCLHATFAATSVAGALALIAATGEAAEDLDHHPDLDWRYRRVHIRSTTHSAGHRLTRLDLALADRVSAAAARLGIAAERPPDQPADPPDQHEDPPDQHEDPPDQHEDPPDQEQDAPDQHRRSRRVSGSTTEGQ